MKLILEIVCAYLLIAAAFYPIARKDMRHFPRWVRIVTVLCWPYVVYVVLTDKTKKK